MDKNRQVELGLTSVWYYDPSRPNHYTDEQKHQLIQDYLSSGKTKAEIWHKYTGQKEEHGQIIRWMRKLGYIENEQLSQNNTFAISTRQYMDNSKRKTESKNSTLDFEKLQLEKRIAELEKQLKEAELKAIAFSTMVDIAEREFNIPIRKKSNTKPSKK